MPPTKDDDVLKKFTEKLKQLEKYFDKVGTKILSLNLKELGPALSTLTSINMELRETSRLQNANRASAKAYKDVIDVLVKSEEKHRLC